MTAPQQIFEQFLAQQRQEYGQSLPGKLLEIKAQWHSIRSGAQGEAALVTLERQAHTLAGTAGTLGFSAVGQAAKSLELLVQRAVQSGPDWTGLCADIDRAIGKLTASLPEAGAAPADPSSAAKDA